MLLHGVIDSPDIPLNVSRSFLQADSNVKKINSYITKKVADKLSELFKADRKAYEEKWTDIGLFVKYGMVSEDKFYDKAKDFVLVTNTKNENFTLNEYKEKVEPYKPIRMVSWFIFTPMIRLNRTPLSNRPIKKVTMYW
jgi:molecular chaperone HtpG